MPKDRQGKLTGMEIIKLKAYIEAWSKMEFHEVEAEVRWENGHPLLTQEMLPLIWQVFDEDMEGHALVDALGRITEASSAKILASQIAGLPLSCRADGAVEDTGAGWYPLTPVTVTAGGTGSPPATVFMGSWLPSTHAWDVAVWVTVDTVSGGSPEYQFDFREDPLAADAGIGPVNPAHAGVFLPLAAGETFPGNSYGFRFMGITPDQAIGIANGAAGDWPNDAVGTFTGFARQVVP
jgi:hypothetical protein